uniref:Uncharacterized protein n=1 Tax=Vespula pensylvanica TaxID=30213 RepID=A0A834NZA3_VESPE|nr:hypothetical protein H0235_009783 [Vespula pensylvanica]
MKKGLEEWSAAAAQIAAWQPLSPRHDSYIPLERVSAVTTTTAIHPCRRIPFPHPTSPHVHPHSPTLFSLRWSRNLLAWADSMPETSRNRSDLRESLSLHQEALPNDENKRIDALVKINRATTTKSQRSRQFSLIPPLLPSL